MNQRPPTDDEKKYPKHHLQFSMDFVFDKKRRIYKPEAAKSQDQCQCCSQPIGQATPFVVDIKRDRFAFVFTFLACIISLATLYVVAKYTYFAGGQLVQMQRAADATYKAAEAATKANTLAEAGISQNVAASRLDERAWVAVTAVNGTKPEIGQKFMFSIHFIDTGKTPAINVIIHPGDELFDAGQRPNLSLKHDTVRLGVLSPGSERNYENGLDRGAVKAGNLTQADLAFLKSKTISVHGKITYDDVFGCHHWITYCTYLKDDWSGYAFCPEGNDTDHTDLPCHDN